MRAADLFNFFDQHQGSTTAILTAALVGVTIYYAWQNRQMVREMAATREVTVLPKLVLEWTMMSSVIAT